jgi:uncharacterized protein YjaG (DUF416 family)
MDEELLQDIDGYLVILGAILGTWSPPQRIAFAAALAERWLPAYRQFAEAESWGDPDLLQGILEAVWDHVRGKSLSPAKVAEYRKAVVKNCPDMDEFDAWQALCACQILDQTLDCCSRTDPNEVMELVKKAACAAHDAAAQEEPDDDPESKRRTWRQPAVQSEFANFYSLAQRVYWLQRPDGSAVDAFRRSLRT